MPSGHIIHESGRPSRHIYFPTNAIVSLLHVTQDGASVEVAGVGNEGTIGIGALMGGMAMPDCATVLCAGHAFRLPTPVLIHELHRPGGRSGALHQLLLRYTQARITQISQTAACNRHHSIQQRLCRWILSNLDRSSSSELAVTHEMMACMLGVRREGITEAAGRCQQAGLIRYHRGHIILLDRAGLEEQACECYRVVKMEFDRLLPGESAAQAAPADGMPMDQVPPPYVARDDRWTSTL